MKKTPTWMIVTRMTGGFFAAIGLVGGIAAEDHLAAGVSIVALAGLLAYVLVKTKDVQ